MMNSDAITIIGSAFAGAAAVLAFMDKRDRDIEARMSTRFEAEIAGLRHRIERLEAGNAMAGNHIVLAMNSASRLQGNDQVRDGILSELTQALEALK